MKIGMSLVLDATGTEQACSSSTFSVAVNHTGACCGFNTSLGGHFEAIDIATAVLVSAHHVLNCICLLLRDAMYFHPLIHTATICPVFQNASTSSAPIFTWMHDCYSLSTGPNKNDSLYPDMPPVRAGLLA